MNTYQTDSERLMKEVVQQDRVGGFMVQCDGKETLYAVHHNGLILERTVDMPNKSFNGKGWEKTEQVPADAEWIGQYKI